MVSKVLILTCSTGEGHNSAARALETALRRENIACELADPVSFQSERAKNTIASLYNNTIRKAPSIFGLVYKLGDIYSASKLPSPVYWANSKYAQALQTYILEQKFDAVICTHLYGMEAMTAIRKDSDFPVPCYGVLTDYTCIPFIDETDLDEYFVPCEEAKKYLVSRGVAEEKVLVTGIPVDEVFASHIDKAVAREKLNIPQDKRVFLVMTGGIGCENMIGLCDELLESLKQDGQVYVLVGKNEKLKSKLDEKYSFNPRIQTVAFTREVALYMAASDVMISKPGGLSSTEAGVANIPLVHVHAIPGCETKNARFFSENGMSMAAHNAKEAVQYAQLLAYREKSADAMRAKQREFIPAHAARTIVQEVCHL